MSFTVSRCLLHTCHTPPVTHTHYSLPSHKTLLDSHTPLHSEHLSPNMPSHPVCCYMSVLFAMAACSFILYISQIHPLSLPVLLLFGFPSDLVLLTSPGLLFLHLFRLPLPHMPLYSCSLLSHTHILSCLSPLAIFVCLLPSCLSFCLSCLLRRRPALWLTHTCHTHIVFQVRARLLNILLGLGYGGAPLPLGSSLPSPY